jgi:hypothetical protein
MNSSSSSLNYLELNHKFLVPVMDVLSAWNLEECINDVIQIIYGEEYSEVRQNKGISFWNQRTLCTWINTIPFLPEIEKQALIQAIHREYVTGSCFSELHKQDHFDELYTLSLQSKILIGVILSFWELGLDYTLPAPLPPVPLGVLAGYISDLRSVSVEEAKTLIAVNAAAMTFGDGTIYGQLVVLGHLEHRLIEKRWIPFGVANMKFILRRRSDFETNF